MKQTRLATLCAALGLAAFSSSSFSQTTNAIDNASNYSGGWTNGANGGSGFGPWALSSGNGASGFGGTFTGISTNAGVTGISSNSFGLYANPNGSGAFANAERTFSNALAIGQTLSFKWAINWDSGSDGNKGFSLFAGSSEIFNINNGGSATITLKDVGNVFTNYGTAAMNWSFTRTATNAYRVTATGRNGTDAYSSNLTVTNGAIDRIRFYASQMQAGDAAQPYFNDFLITTTTADVTPPEIILAAGVDKITWVAKGSSAVSITSSDVSASDNSGVAPNITPSTSSVSTANDGLTTVTYTATDGSGNSANVTRLIAVGNAAPGYHNLRFPAAMTVNTNSSDFAYGEIYVDGATPGAGAASGITAWVAVNTNNTDPATWTNTVWSPANYVGEEGNNDNYQGVIAGTGRAPGTYYYATRFRLGTNDANTNYFYGGIGADGNGGTWGGTRSGTVVVTNITGGATNVVTNNVTYTNGNGVLTVVPVRNVTFAVDMGVQIFKGLFDPSTNGVEVRGDFNGFNGGSTLLRQGTTTLYTNTFAVNGTNGASLAYKFFGYGTNELAWETLQADRLLTLSSSNQTLPTAFFSDLSESRKITFRVNMSAQSNTGTVNLAGSFNGWTQTALTPQGNGIYAGEFTVDGPLSAVEYKFYNGSTAEPDILNRTITDSLPNLASSPLAVVYFNNVLPQGSTFTGWAGGATLDATNVGKYAIGGASSPTATDGVKPTSTVSGGNLVLTAIVRTDDAKLTVVGEAVTNLADYAPGGTVASVSGVDTVDQTGVPAGHKRQTFTVAQGADARKFLRLKATLAP